MDKKNKSRIFLIEFTFVEFAMIFESADFINSYIINNKSLNLYLSIIFTSFAVLFLIITAIYWFKGLFKNSYK